MIDRLSFPIAQNVPAGGMCVGVAILIFGVLIFLVAVTAYEAGYNRGRRTLLDEQRRGFSVEPLTDQKPNDPETK
jgi:hypothetical protein